jgi:LPS-assembly protein
MNIMLGGANPGLIRAQEVTSPAPPAAQVSITPGAATIAAPSPAAPLPQMPTAQQAPDLPAAPDISGSEEPLPYPVAQVVPDKQQGTKVTIESTNPQTRVGSVFTLDKDVVIVYGDRTIRADHIEYDSDSGDIVATGHLVVSGGKNSEYITASHGEFNVKSQTGRFYDVNGSVGLKHAAGARPASARVVYDNGNPFLFTGRIVVKRGPQEYDVIDGSVTSCQLPKPDWLLKADLFSLDGEKARAKNSVFHLLNVPLLYLPYVTHPVDPEDRQSGLMIPVIGDSSSKGITIGEEIYFVINRSMDVTLGSIYYSARGFSESGTFRYRGLGQNFITGHFSALQDRGYTPTGGVYTNQGGEDVVVKARYDVNPGGEARTRLVADTEYLSSYVYREAFTENFNQAVSTDILSSVYAVRNWRGYSAALRADRYEGVKPALQTPAEIDAAAPVVNSQLTIFHIPALTLAATDRGLAKTPFVWSLDASMDGLKRTQPEFTTEGVGRFDLHPELALPLTFGGLHIRSSIAARETAYTHSRQTPFIAGDTPVEASGGFNRSDFEAQVDVRPSVLERTFDSPLIDRLFGGPVKHTIEPALTYRYVTGVNNFAGVLRFDDIDVVSDTNELEYGLTQRLFLHPRKARACKPTEVADASDEDTSPDDAVNGKPAPVVARCTSREFFSWRLTQKAFFNETFGNAVSTGRRNIFESTLNLTGVAFLTQAQETSPILSRLRLRPSEKLDVEWNFDYDAEAGKFTTNNVFVDAHQGSLFGGFSYAGLNAPGRFETNGEPSSTTRFSQIRFLLGYGTPTKAGLSTAANAGIDLKLGTVQYASLQSAYNWNCCGFSVEYRKYELGSVRNENAYRFNFTLANIGTAGNLRRAERLF